MGDLSKTIILVTSIVIPILLFLIVLVDIFLMIFFTENINILSNISQCVIFLTSGIILILLNRKIKKDNSRSDVKYYVYLSVAAVGIGVVVFITDFIQTIYGLLS